MVENVKLSKLAKIANYEKECVRESKCALAKALDVLVRALNLHNGSLKVYVHQGKASPRVEIQTDITKQIEI